MEDPGTRPDGQRERLRREIEALKEKLEAALERERKLRDENRNLLRRLASIAANERLGVQLYVAQ